MNIKQLIMDRIKISEIKTGTKISPLTYYCGLTPKDIVVCSKRKDDEIYIIKDETVLKEKVSKFLPAYFSGEMEKFHSLPFEVQSLLDKAYPIRVIH